MHWNYTPTIHGVRPPVLYYGMVANVYMNTKEAPRGKKTGELPVSLVLEGFRMEHESYLDEDTNLNRNADMTVQGIVQTESRAVNANLEVLFNGVGKALYNTVSSQTCDINGLNCYNVKVAPSITEISQTAGYTTGGQELKIKGYGFDATPTVMVGDALCTLTSYTETEIICETGATTLPTATSFEGSHGLYHARFNQTAGATALNYEDYLTGTGVAAEAEGVETILTSFEIPDLSNYGNSNDHIMGYFKAPVDGQYQFHMSGDDAHTFWMSPASDPMNPDAKE
jgi:hypothetical protein